MVDINQQVTTLNPSMKFTPPKKGVVPSNPVYQYSLNEELKVGEDKYRELTRTLSKRQKLTFEEKHPNFKRVIKDILLVGLGVFTAGALWRYRHSIAGLKNLFKNPKKTPPSFKADVKKIFASIFK